jgi:hypothetical protein
MSAEQQLEALLGLAEHPKARRAPHHGRASPCD